jgi:hypothetical protein
LRLFLETISYYNARYLATYTKLSSGMIIYLTHSFVSLLLFYDIIKHKKQIISIIKNRTGIPFNKFITAILLLSVFHNMKSFIRFICFAKLSDASVISLSCTNILFTKYLFSRATMNDHEKILFLLIIMNILVVTVTDSSIISSLGIIVTAAFSSLYNVLYKRLMVNEENISQRIENMLNNKKTALKNKEKITLINFYENNASFNNLPEKEISKSFVLENNEQNDKETYYTAYYFIIISGFITLVFYWPMVFLDYECQFTARGLFHCGIGILLAQLITFYHFMLIGFISPLFAQLTNVFFKVIILFLHVSNTGIQINKVAALLIILFVFCIDKFQSVLIE